jgi:hypothetical protein
MTRSTGLPRKRGLAGISRVIRARSRPVTVTRPTVSQGSLDEQTETLSDHQEDLWLFDPRKRDDDQIAGERIEGNLGALAVGRVDIEPGDRVTHGGVEYEVDTVVGHPDDADADGSYVDEVDFWMVDFTRRQG